LSYAVYAVAECSCPQLIVADILEVDIAFLCGLVVLLILAAIAAGMWHRFSLLISN